MPPSSETAFLPAGAGFCLSEVVVSLTQTQLLAIDVAEQQALGHGDPESAKIESGPYCFPAQP